MAKNASQQWVVRYRNHKTKKLNTNWIEDIMWSKEAAKLAFAHAKLYWKDVELVPVIKPRKVYRDRWDDQED